MLKMNEKREKAHSAHSNLILPLIVHSGHCPQVEGLAVGWGGVQAAPRFLPWVPEQHF
jgi:hypothetical protein